MTHRDEDTRPHATPPNDANGGDDGSDDTGDDDEDAARGVLGPREEIKVILRDHQPNTEPNQSQA